MAEIVLILGNSGSGKTTSLRNFKNDEITLISVTGKRLPFRNDINQIKTRDYKKIVEVLKNSNKKVMVIDDSQYLMAFEQFDKITQRGFDKFVEMGSNFYKLLKFCQSGLPDDVIVYFLHHIEMNEYGMIKIKTVGKMLDNQLVVEGLFSIVLMAERIQKNYSFITQTDGRTTVKSPIGMFDEVIDNDLKLVDKKIREYWNIK